MQAQHCTFFQGGSQAMALCAIITQGINAIEVTEDREFLYDYGAELMLEIARFWASLASEDETTGRYSIRGVMGPDEFHTAYPGKDPSVEGGLDNNAYTNFLVSWLLTRTLDVLDLLPDSRRHPLCDKLGLGESELSHWDHISRNLTIAFHADGTISQFDGYEHLEEFDWEGYRTKYGQIQRLDRILEEEGTDPNRYKVSKQADVLMLFFLFYRIPNFYLSYNLFQLNHYFWLFLIEILGL